MHKLCVVIASVALWGRAQAGEVAYVEWSSQREPTTNAFWGYAAIDGKPTTAWCSEHDGVGEKLTIGFIGDQEFDEVALIVGALEQGQLAKGRARIKVLGINDGQTQQKLTYKDKAALQALKVKPALGGRRVSFEVLEVYGGGDGQPVCITDLVLKNRGKLVTGSVLDGAIRGIQGQRRELLHFWVDQPTAPERYLTFSMSGSFVWAYEPNEGERARETGTYQVIGETLTLKPRSGPPANVKVRFDRVADGSAIHTMLVIEGAGFHPKLAGSYQAGADQ